MAKKEIKVIGGSEKKVDEYLALRSQIKILEGEIDVREAFLKNKGKEAVGGFGTVELASSKDDVRFQVQVRRPTITIPADQIDDVEKLVGATVFPLLFDVSDGGEAVKDMDALKAFIIQHGGEMEDFIVRRRTATAKDTWLEEAVAERIIGKGWKKISGAVKSLLKTREGCVAGKVVIK